MSNRQKVSRDDQQYIELGKKLKEFYELDYASKKKTLGFSFLKGLATGAGAFIGGSLVIALLLWTLSLFNQLPLIW